VFFRERISYFLKRNRRSYGGLVKDCQPAWPRRRCICTRLRVVWFIASGTTVAGRGIGFLAGAAPLTLAV
jgi:hypothetical protein